MDPRRVLPFLLLVACVISAASTFMNGWGGPNLIRRTRRISLNEYLIPPPLPKFNTPGRTGRLAPQSEAPGYFAQLMSWLNPFGFGSPSPPPASSPHSEAPYPPSSKFIQPPPLTPGPVGNTYGDSPPPVYDRPPLPPPSFNNHPQYLPPIKGRNCNPCNKVPWVPMQHGSHTGDSSYGPPPPPPPPSSPQLSSSNGGYLPPNEVPHDAYHAATQEVRAPDFSFIPQYPTGQDGPLIAPLPNPHLHPGPMPPLFKAADFNYPIQAALDGNSGYAPQPSGNGPSGNGSFPNIVEPSFNGGHNEHSIYSNPSGYPNIGDIQQGYNNPGTNNGEFQHFDVQNHIALGDLSSSGTQISHGHINPVLGKQGFEDIAIHQGSLNSINHDTSIGSSSVNFHHPSGISNNEEFYDTTGPNGPLGNPLDNSSQNAQNLPSSYGISGLHRIPNKYNDLSSSSSVVKDSHAPPQSSDGSSAKIGDLIHFEESPLLDLTHKGESRTDSSSIPPASNVFVNFNKSAETTATTLASDNELFGTTQNIASTKSHFSADYLQKIDSSRSPEDLKINDSVTENLDLYSPKDLRGQEASNTVSSGHAGYLWPILSTTLRDTEREEYLNSLVKSYDDVENETLNQIFNVNSENASKMSARQQGAKRNKQVQVIIPYTSQYTPFPFHPPHGQNYGRKSPYTDETNHDNYISEESRTRIKVVNPNFFNTHQIWPTPSAILEEVTRKSIGTKVNNSIDVHRLQKNIDNWTIQEYSKGTTVSTVSPSSVNPYLFPSKQIPDEYLTTIQPVDHTDDPHDNVKTFALAGFSFNDLEHESSASNRVEGSRIQVIRNEDSKSPDSSTDTVTASTKNEITWEDFSVDISPVDKERVYVVTPQPVTTPKSKYIEQKKEKTAKEAEKNSKELLKTSETDTQETKKKSNTFESIEKAYQVLPQAVNNLAVASTGPESVPLWGIMEHEEFASLDDSEDDNEDGEFSEIPVLYAGHSKVSRASR